MKIIRTILFMLSLILAVGLALTTLAGVVSPSRTVVPSLLAYGYLPLLAANVLMALVWGLMRRWEALLPVAVIGLRLYYVAFHWDRYAGDLSEILNIREGGLAIHGGLIFGFLAAWLMCRHKGISILNGMDLAVPCIALGQAIGRWGNFFNEEAHGCETDFPISVLIDGVNYHATFLYESLWCLMLFFLLSAIARKRRFTGQIFCLYLMLYSLERFFVEFLRTDSLMIGSFKQAMVLSACLIVVGAVAYGVLSKRTRY